MYKPYFPHDLNARNDPKLQKILKILKHEGCFIFWCLVEMMYEQGGRLKLSEIETYAFELHTSPECINKVIEIAFQKNSKNFWSISCLGRIKKMKEKSEKSKMAATTRWNRDDADAMRTHSERNASKVNKSKVNKIKINKEVNSNTAWIKVENKSFSQPTANTNTPQSESKDLLGNDLGPSGRALMARTSAEVRHAASLAFADKGPYTPEVKDYFMAIAVAESEDAERRHRGH